MDALLTPSEGYVAELLAALWTVATISASRVLPGIYGTRSAHGAPLWRSALSTPTQWAVLPACWMIDTPTSERFFVYTFALYMLVNFVITPLSKLLLLHHVFCLVGHFVVVLMLPATLPVYFAGVVTLELGSGFYNMFCLRPDVRWRVIAYAVGMSASNAAALAICIRWVLLDIALAPKVLNLVITAIMVYLRQKTCYTNVAGSRAKHE